MKKWPSFALSTMVYVLISALALSTTAALCEEAPPAASAAAPCPGNADALGTARILAVDAAVTPRVGRKHFRETLPLAPKEVALTFDDGPLPGTTAQELALVLGRIEANRGGIVLFHDTKLATAAMLPAFLRALKSRGYRAVHVVSP